MFLTPRSVPLQVYDTPPMAVKGPNGQDPGQEIYDVPPSVEKNLHQTVSAAGKALAPQGTREAGGAAGLCRAPVLPHAAGTPGAGAYVQQGAVRPSGECRALPPSHALGAAGTHTPERSPRCPLVPLQVYDVPPSVSKDVPDGPVREETYDVPPAFAKQKAFDPTRHPLVLTQQEPYLPEDVYDVPPAAGKCAPEPSLSHEIYDVPPSLKKLSSFPSQEVYDVPRDLHGPSKGSVDTEGEYIYDVPPQVDREAKAADGKRLSASSTGSTRSNLSSSSLDVVPVKEPAKGAGKEFSLDLDAAMEMLAKLQHGIGGAVSYLMSFISANWRSAEHMEANAASIRGAAEGVQAALRDLLEFARGAVGNAAQASDRSLYAKLSKQLQKMEEVYQALGRHSQALDACHWAPNALVGGKPGTDDLELFVMYSRGVPDDTKQLASFLHGNASLLFKRTKQAPEGNGHGPAHPSDKASSIQSRPLPSPPKLLAQESPDGPYENNESGWMEDYDYVHLQVGTGRGHLVVPGGVVPPTGGFWLTTRWCGVWGSPSVAVVAILAVHSRPGFIFSLLLWEVGASQCRVGGSFLVRPAVCPVLMLLPPLQGKEEFEKTQKELLEKGNIIRQSKDQLEHQQVTGTGWAGGHLWAQLSGDPALGRAAGFGPAPLVPTASGGVGEPLPWLCVTPSGTSDAGEEPGVAVLFLGLSPSMWQRPPGAQPSPRGLVAALPRPHARSSLQLKQFERLEQEVTRPIDNDLSNWSPPQHYGPARGGGALCASDRQLLLFYLEQCEANLTTLTNAVDAFFTAVSTNQPPKIFVAHSKFIILSAHKLVFIGDTLSRQAKAQEVRHKVTHYSNLLCEMLKEIVVTTKAAALHYPSPAASKDMVERVKDLANSTQQFRMVLGQLAAM